MTRKINNPITEEELDRWITGLRSGKYRQGRGQLRDPEGGYCCLGLKCHVDGFDLDQRLSVNDRMPWAESGGIAPSPEPLSGLSIGLTRLLAKKNDSGQSFYQIADFLDENRDRILAGGLGGW